MPMAERCARFAQSREKALELFASKGFGQVGMRELASHLGLAPGSLYHHYPSKQHLLLDLIEEFYDERLAALRRIAKRPGAMAARVPRIVQAHVQLHRELPLHFRLVERDSPCLNEEQQQQVARLRDAYEGQLLSLLGQETRLDDPAVRAAGHALAALLNSAPAWLTEHVPHQDGLIEHWVAAAIERLLPCPRPQALAG